VAEGLAPLDVAGRLARLRDRFDHEACDALVVTDLVNVRYLTGFTGSNGVLLVTADGATIVTDGRYRTQVGTQLEAVGLADAVDVAIGNDPAPALASAASPASGSRPTTSAGPRSAAGRPTPSRGRISCRPRAWCSGCGR
jgi:Xaa-Pro aminopeptidase